HQMRDNGFWLTALSKAQSEPERLDRIREKKEMLQSITAADLQKLAQEYLKPETRQNAEIVSSKVASASASGATQAAK
ncbi:MAG TPA: hypothetical protein VFS69_06355, partial [Sphingomicrobium sp.]|nr:hypothetical protein [Sphingomicrobium sp.]